MSFKSKQRAKHSHLFGEDPLNASTADDPLFGSSGRSSSPLSRSASSTTSNPPLSVVGDPLSSSTPSAASRPSPISSNSSSPRQPPRRLPQTNGKANTTSNSNSSSNNSSSIFGDIDVSKLGRRSPRPSDSAASPSPPPPPPRSVKQQQQQPQQQPPPPPPRPSSASPPQQEVKSDATRPPSPPQSARQSREESQPDVNQPPMQPQQPQLQRQSLFSRFIKSSSSSSSSISSTKSDDTPTKPSQKPPPPPVPPRQQPPQHPSPRQQPPVSPQARPPVPERRPAVPPRRIVQDEEETDEEDNQPLVPAVVIEDEATRAFAADADTFTSSKIKPTRFTYDDDPELLASLTQDLRFDDRPAPALSVSTPTHAPFDDDVVADPWSVPPAAFFNPISRAPVGSTSSPLLKSSTHGNGKKVSVNDIEPSKRSAFSDLIDSWNGQPRQQPEVMVEQDQRQQQFLKRVAAEQRDVGFAGIRENVEEEEEEDEKRPVPSWDIEDTNPWR